MIPSEHVTPTSHTISRRLVPHDEPGQAWRGCISIQNGIDKVQLFAAERGAVNEARNMAIYLCRYLRGVSLTTIGRVFDIQSYSTVSSIFERFKGRIRAERKLKRKVEEIKKVLMRQEQT